MKRSAILLLVVLSALLVPPNASMAQNGTVTVDATRTPLSEVLSILASKSGLNIVTSPEVEALLDSLRAAVDARAGPDGGA